MARPLALSFSGRNGVSVGMSLSAVPKAPGAPSGHSGIGDKVSAKLNIWIVAKLSRKKMRFMIGNLSGPVLFQMGG